MQRLLAGDGERESEVGRGGGDIGRGGEGGRGWWDEGPEIRRRLRGGGLSSAAGIVDYDLDKSSRKITITAKEFTLFCILA